MILKKVKPSQKGLKKLPTAVRNKISYMNSGGSAGEGAGSLAEIIASGGVGLTGKAKKVYDLAKEMKPSGRLNEDDLKVAKEMLMQKSDDYLNNLDGKIKNVLARHYTKFISTPAGQTKSTKTPKQSIFQQLKKDQNTKGTRSSLVQRKSGGPVKAGRAAKRGYGIAKK